MFPCYFQEKIGNMLDNKVAENISLSEIVNNLQNKLQYQTDLCNTLKATLMDKDLQMESTLADNDHLKTVAKEKDLQVMSYFSSKILIKFYDFVCLWSTAYEIDNGK